MNIKLNNETYEVVDKIPEGYIVWNVDDLMGSDEYIPLCTENGNSVPSTVRPDALKAIKLAPEQVRLLRRAATIGIDCLSKAKDALTIKYTKPDYANMTEEQKQKFDTRIKDRMKTAELVIPIFKHLT